MSSQRSLAVLALLLWLGLCGLAYWLAETRVEACRDYILLMDLREYAGALTTAMGCFTRASEMRDWIPIIAIIGLLAPLLWKLLRQSASPPAP